MIKACQNRPTALSFLVWVKRNLQLLTKSTALRARGFTYLPKPFHLFLIFKKNDLTSPSFPCIFLPLLLANNIQYSVKFPKIASLDKEQQI